MRLTLTVIAALALSSCATGANVITPDELEGERLDRAIPDDCLVAVSRELNAEMGYPVPDEEAAYICWSRRP